jgi:hypothetical protein
VLVKRRSCLATLRLSFYRNEKRADIENEFALPFVLFVLNKRAGCPLIAYFAMSGMLQFILAGPRHDSTVPHSFAQPANEWGTRQA